MNSTPSTTGEEVIGHLAVSGPARSALDRWKSTRSEVAKHVVRHVSRVPYQTSSRQLQDVVSRTEHPLGGISKREIEGVVSIRDWNPRYAMTHVLHYALEEIGEPFAYEEFREFSARDCRARSMLWEPSQEAVADAARQYGKQRAHDAMQWRIGLSYYSFMRELVTVVGLREIGIDLRIHPLADALFRADAWAGRCVVSLYIGNAVFRDGQSGRKPQAEGLLGNSFRYVSLNLPTQHAFGSLHVPSAEALRDAAQRIRHVVERC
ncbi:hypothetical protein [Mycobacteroides abscessus]